MTELNGVHSTRAAVTADPDPGLIRKAQGGDRESLKALLTLVAPSVRQWALARAADPDGADDLSQEVLVLLVRKLGSYRGEARFLTWLFTVTRNQAVEAARRRKRRREKMDQLRIETGPGERATEQDETGVDRQRIRDLVEIFVTELPQRQREVFQMADLQGLSSPEIGSILRLAPGSVRVALLKARRTLRRRILASNPEIVEEYLS
jgi:RNA polymerase sigma-70 factor (ECF subfamily)